MSFNLNSVNPLDFTTVLREREVQCSLTSVSQGTRGVAILRMTRCLLPCLLLSLLLAGVAAGQVPRPAPQLPENRLSQLVLNPVSFGADPTGAADSSPAFQRLMVEAGTNRQVRILIPPGRFRLAKRVVLAASGNASNYGMRVEGAGEDVTELLVDNAEGGILFNGEHISRMTFSIAGLSFVAVRPDSGTALKFEIPNPGDQHARQFNAENLLIRGERFDNGSFSNGIIVRNAWYPRLVNVKVTSRYGGDSLTPQELLQHRSQLKHAFLLEDCYSPLIDSCYVWGGDYGLVQRAVHGGQEDGIVAKSYFVGNIVGITLDIVRQAKYWAEPGFHIDNCHVAFRDSGILVRGVRQMNISHCLFYCSDRSGAAFDRPKNGPARDFEPADIDIVYGSDMIIKGNIFTEPANPRRVAVRISKDSGFVLITANQFNIEGTAIRNQSQKPSFSADNMFGGSPDWSAGITPYKDETGTLQTRDFQTPKK